MTTDKTECVKYNVATFLYIAEPFTSLLHAHIGRVYECCFTLSEGFWLDPTQSRTALESIMFSITPPKGSK